MINMSTLGIFTQKFPYGEKEFLNETLSGLHIDKKRQSGAILT